MGWSVDPVPPAVVFHYSEDPGIAEFIPHVPVTNPTMPPMIWTIEPAYAPLYWFPRDCARVAVWAHDDTQRAVLAGQWETASTRVQFVAASDEPWMARTRLYEYAFAPEPFEPWPDAEGQWMASRPVRPHTVVPMGDLVDVHTAAAVELRFETDLAARRAEVLASGLPFSIVRWPAPDATT